MVDAVLFLKGRDRLVEAADAALPDLVQEFFLALVLRAFPDGFEPVHELALGRSEIHVLLGDYPVLDLVG